MKKRILTSIAIVLTIALLFVLKVLVSPFFFDAFLLIVVGFAAYEMSQLLTRIGKFHHQSIVISFAVLMGLSSILTIEFGLGFAATIGIDLAIVLVGFLTSFFISLMCKKHSLAEMKIRALPPKLGLFSIKKALSTLTGLIYPSLLFTAMILLNHIDLIKLESVSDFGGKFSLFALIFAFTIPMFTDSFAMLMGMLFGGKKLCPKISPNKTISGAIGGTVWCVLLSCCVYLILGAIDYFNPVISSIAIWEVALIVLFGSIVAQAGDILESFFKRKANVKDSGKILPGHGGMLDRIDSYISVAPYLLIALTFVLI